MLPVVVTDKQNRYVSDLAREQFVVFDNGRKVSIEFFTNEDAPATIGLVVDASGSMGKAGRSARRGARVREDQQSRRTSCSRFVSMTMCAARSPIGGFSWPSDLVALEQAIGSLRAEGRTALYDALIAGLDHLARARARGKALVVISDGGDNASQATLDQVLARARDSNAAIYTVGIFDADDIEKNPGVLKSLARTTGGERFLPRSPGELLQACQQIAREIRSGYTHRLRAAGSRWCVSPRPRRSRTRRPRDASRYGRGPATLPASRSSQP